MSSSTSPSNLTPQQQTQITEWLNTFNQWSVDMQTQALRTLSTSSLHNAIFKTDGRSSVPVPVEYTDRQFGFQLIIKEFSQAEFVIDDYYCTRMSINIDRWTKPVIREDRVSGTITEKTSDRIVMEGKIDPETPFKLAFNVKAAKEDKLRILTLDMKETTYFDKVRKFKPYLEEWKPHFEKIELEELKLESVVSASEKAKHGAAGHHGHGIDSSCCL